jgi:Sec-independent protein translocase protein TatA
MILMVGFLLVLGLIVFGPRKTIEMAQEVGRALAHVKEAAGQVRQSALETDQFRHAPACSPNPISPPQSPLG